MIRRLLYQLDRFHKQLKAVHHREQIMIRRERGQCGVCIKTQNVTIPPTGCFYVELDTEGIAGEVFGLLIEKFKETTNLSHDSNVEQLASEALIELASKGKDNSADIASKKRDRRRIVRTLSLHPTRQRPLDPQSITSSLRQTGVQPDFDLADGRKILQAASRRR